MQLYVLLDEKRKVKSYALPKYPQPDPWKAVDVPDYFKLNDLREWHYDGGRLVPDNTESDINKLEQELKTNKLSLDETNSQLSVLAYSTMVTNTQQAKAISQLAYQNMTK